MRQGGFARSAAWLAVAAAAALASAGPAAAAPRMVIRANVSDALDGRLLLSRCQGGCRLYSSVDGVTSRLPVKPFYLGEDAREASLGIGPGGHVLAAYTRCNGSLRDCDLYTYDFATGRERRLPVSHVRGALTSPTVSGNRVAFNYDRSGRDVDSKRFGIYWSRLDGRRMHPVATMPFDIGVYLPKLDLAGGRLAYSGYSALNSCLDQSQVRVQRLDAKHGYGRLIASGSDRTDVISPQWSGRTLYFGRDRFTKRSYRHDFTVGQITNSRIERHRPGAAGNETTAYRRAAMKAVLPDGDALLYRALSRRGGRGGVYDAGRPAFTRVARPR
jgi:hypothetical protein